MIHLLSPAKSLDFDSKLPTEDFSMPQFIEDSEKLINKLRKSSKKKLRELMSISEDLAQLNADRYQSWTGKAELSDESRQAIFAFKGDVYLGLQALEELSPSDVDYAQSHLLILSGLYGILKPKDLIEPYRLEMGTKLKVGRKDDLYSFWGYKLTAHINEALKHHEEKVVINLASNEYFKAVDPKKVEGKIIHPEFKDAKNGKYKFITFYGKKARGLMSRYLIKNQISNLEDIKGFDLEGYRYNAELSSEDKPVFTREENQAG
ncbi:MAG: hypothetical protein CMP59_07885 [Flavobacteriales bacterium]|nr:hypothetical protein [Flavobacteriales bacterium]|tara:strand:+ start:887 stop:1675 length:789 start_codon:yes stop_codon:yes gene_type:complete